MVRVQSGENNSFKFFISVNINGRIITDSDRVIIFYAKVKLSVIIKQVMHDQLCYFIQAVTIASWLKGVNSSVTGPQRLLCQPQRTLFPVTAL